MLMIDQAAWGALSIVVLNVAGWARAGEAAPGT